MQSSKSKVDELRDVLKTKKEAEIKKEKKEVLPEEGIRKEAVAEDLKAVESSNETDELFSCIRAAEEEAKQHYDKLLRVMADFENFKKRVSREQEEKTRFANERLLFEILPVLDDLDRLLDHVLPDADKEVKTLAEGADLVRRTLFNVLQKFGLSQIETDGELFDPAMHEALSCIPSQEHEDGVIIGVHRRGYKLNDRVIRAAQVTVAKKQI